MARTVKELKGIWWNVWHDSRDNPEGAKKIAARVSELVAEYDPDWVCLQEAYRYQKWGKAGDVVGLVEQALGWDKVFIVGNEFHYTSKKSVKKGKNYSEGVVTFSKWPIVSHEAITLGPSIWGEQRGLGGERTLLETLLKTPFGQIMVGNAHWTRIRYNFRAHRKNEMQTFKKRIESLPAELAYAVGGDFNTLPSHPIIKRLRKSLDLHTGGIKNTTWVHKAKRGRLIRCNLDYVGTLLSSPLKLMGVQQLERKPSDHTPLLATFSYGTKGKGTREAKSVAKKAR